MPATVLLDVAEGSEIDDGISGTTLKRVAYVYGLDAGAPLHDPATLLRSLSASGMPQLFDAFPNNATYFCNRRVVHPTTDSSCYVDLYYFQGRVQGSTWLMTDGITMVSDTTQIHPNGQQLKVKLDVGSGSSKQTKSDVATLSFPRAMRRITFEGSVVGFNIPGVSGGTAPVLIGTTGVTVPKKDVYTAAINCVNSKAWQGYGIGYWWFNEWSVTTPDRGASNTIRASFISKMTEDWSSYAVLRDTNVGKFVTVDDTVVAALKGLNYSYGLQDGGGNYGILKAGMYPLADFIPLFGT